MTLVEACAVFARAQVKAWSELAEALLDVDEAPLAITEEVRDPSDDHNLGARQRQIIALDGLASEGGVKTAEIANAISYELPNTYSTLQALARQGIVEQVPNKEPQHWRLARRYRPNTDAFMKIVGHVKPGEWTTYGDVSIAVVGHNKAARGVGRAAATVPTFPNPERVLMEGGTVNPNWRDSQGRGPVECRRRLEAQGVRFQGEHADPAQRVTWDELQRRDAQAAVNDHEAQNHR